MNISEFPDDVLLAILLIATGHTGLEDKRKRNKQYRNAQDGCGGRCTPPEHRTTNGQTTYRELKPSQTAARISAVCSKWHVIIQRFVPIILHVDDESKWEKVTAMLQARSCSCSHHKDVETSINGVQTKQLSIITSAFIDEKQREALSILSNCTNLEQLALVVVDASGHFTNCSDFLLRLPDTFSIFSRTLSALLMSMDVCQRGAQLETAAIERLTALRTLSIHGGFKFEHFEILYLSNSLLPDLHSICYHNLTRDGQPIISYASSWQLPSLRYLHVKGGEAWQEADSFVLQNKANLEDATFDYHKNRSFENLPGEEQLRTLRISIQMVDLTFGDVRRYRNLRYVGIIGKFAPFPQQTRLEEGMEQFDDALMMFEDRERFPAVERIQLMDIKLHRIRSVKWIPRHTQIWERWVERMRIKNIKFIDKHGRVIAL